tara:strand:+ start:149 stop:868 length:720 start_codon:yes stop_codon:yes gene_type:complete
MSNYKKILFTGASGRFGQVFKKIYNSKKYLYPSRKEFNITNYKSSLKYIKKNKPDLIIHCAALSRPMSIHNTNIIDSIETNIIGTSNLVKACSIQKIKLIYFSTSYVYPGLKGNYKETESIQPINNYAWSKLGGECAVQLYKNSLILRICMTEKPFVHKYAFKNFMTNFIFHDEVAKFLPKLFKYKGIINVGGPIKNVYDFAKKYNSKIKGKYIQRSKTTINRLKPSMNISRLKKIIND